MANPEHLAILERGTSEWNSWRETNQKLSGVSLEFFSDDAVERFRAWHRQFVRPQLIPDLSGADLSKRKLNGINLNYCDLRGTNLSGCSLIQANLIGADLTAARLLNCKLDLSALGKATLDKAVFDWSELDEASLVECSGRQASFCKVSLERASFAKSDLRQARFMGSTLNNADMSDCDLRESEFYESSGFYLSFARSDLSDAELMHMRMTFADLQGAKLRRTSLFGAQIASANLCGATIEDCHVWGISVWNAIVDESTIQSRLRISESFDDDTLTVDHIELAQLLYLLLDSRRLRELIETITARAVLILGRFTKERFPVLSALRATLSRHPSGYIPIVFDFEKPATRDMVETITLLAGLARFVIADITDPRSVPHELSAIIPALPSVPIVPIREHGQRSWDLFEHLQRFSWVADPVEYRDLDNLLTRLDGDVIAQAEMILKSLRRHR